MRRIFQPELRRGRTANRIGILLLLFLLLVLVASVFTGVRAIAA